MVPNDSFCAFAARSFFPVVGMRAAVLLLALSLNPVVGFTQGPVLVSYTSILPSRFHPFRKNDPLVPLSGELVNASAVLKYPRIRQALYH